uniref:Uncharacterized protein n=1 Tax=Podoviridae sp. ctiJY10 TaxID=2826572 RepID=A0A8S5N3X5_9CAUD|nr:MAG TPA: hypothetical protein [Podoviridae sp. ctiJY10]
MSRLKSNPLGTFLNLLQVNLADNTRLRHVLDFADVVLRTVDRTGILSINHIDSFTQTQNHRSCFGTNNRAIGGGLLQVRNVLVINPLERYCGYGHTVGLPEVVLIFFVKHKPLTLGIDAPPNFIQLEIGSIHLERSFQNTRVVGSVLGSQPPEVLGAVRSTQPGHLQSSIFSLDEQTLIRRQVVIATILSQIEVELFIREERDVCFSQYNLQVFNVTHTVTSAFPVPLDEKPQLFLGTNTVMVDTQLVGIVTELFEAQLTQRDFGIVNRLVVLFFILQLVIFQTILFVLSRIIEVGHFRSRGVVIYPQLGSDRFVLERTESCGFIHTLVCTARDHQGSYPIRDAKHTVTPP